MYGRGIFGYFVTQEMFVNLDAFVANQNDLQGVYVKMEWTQSKQ